MDYLILLILRRITNTWAFMRQSFSVVRSYRPLMLLPAISCVFCLLVSIIVLGGGVLVFDIPVHAAQFAPETPRVSAEGIRQLTLAFGFEDQRKTGLRKTDAERRMTEREWLTLFFFYLANYAVITYFNVAFASIVLDHLAGGHATLNDGLQTAWLRKGPILQWAILAATVGLLLKMLSKRSQLGRWIASLLGYSWKLGSYFVIPLLALEDIGPGEALERSAEVLKRKWGEVAVAGFSFSLLFAVLAIPGVVIFFLLAGLLGQAVGFVAILAVSYWVWLAIFMFSAEQVFVASLYRYAIKDEVSKGFHRGDLASAWEGLKPLPIGQAL
jgi:uncharacterized protein DUF6159